MAITPAPSNTSDRDITAPPTIPPISSDDKSVARGMDMKNPNYCMHVVLLHAWFKKCEKPVAVVVTF